MKPGRYPSLSNEDYHGHKGSYSRSALMEFKKSPYHYWCKYLDPGAPKQEMSQAMKFGAAFHMYILEYDLFLQTYAIEPETVLLKDVGRELYELFKTLKNQIKECGKLTISDDEWATMKMMHNAIHKNDEALQLIYGATYEQSLFWEDPESGLLLKARPDIMHSNMIVDLKTCNDASPEAYQRAMVTGGYHVQGAMIREGWKVLTGEVINTVINICIEKTYPYAIGIYIIDEEALDVGEFEFKRLALNLKSALDTNTYECYTPQTIGLPRWAL